MKSVAVERERMRARERERMSRRDQPALRTEPKAYMKKVVDDFSLKKWLGTDTAKLATDDGRLSRPAGGDHISVLPTRRSDRPVRS